MASNDKMELILERWDRFLILEDASLEAYKKDSKFASKLVDLVSKTKDPKKLKTFSTFALSDPEVVEAAKELLEFIKIIKKSNKVFNPAKIDEDILQDLGIQAYSKAQQFANSKLGSLIIKYGPGILTIAAVALYTDGKIDDQFMTNTLNLSKALKEKDSEEIISSILQMGSS